MVKKMKDYNKIEDFKELKKLLLNQVESTLKKEPNAQIFKFVKEILDEAGIELLDKKKEVSKILSLLDSTSKVKDEVLEDILKKRG